MIKKLLFKLFLKKYQNNKLYMIGNSHILNMREKYHKIKKLFEVDYKIFSQNGEDGILDYLLYQLGDTETKVFRDWSWRLLRV